MTEYLSWAKLNPRVRYELTGSGAPPAAPGDFDAESSPITLEVRGGYGDPPSGGVKRAAGLAQAARLLDGRVAREVSILGPAVPSAPER